LPTERTNNADRRHYPAAPIDACRHAHPRRFRATRRCGLGRRGHRRDATIDTPAGRADLGNLGADDGAAPPERVRELATWVEAFVVPDDAAVTPEFAQVARDLEVRVRVELAKLDLNA